MSASYAVNWQEQPGETSYGKLEFGPRSLVLEGRSGAEHRAVEVAYGDLSAVRVARAGSERIAGRPTLVVERGDAPMIRIVGVAQPGIVSELAEQLAQVRLREERAVSRVVVVIPLQPDAGDRVRKLVRRGPPFDPATAGLERHHVFVTAEEAVFVFEGSMPDAIDRLAQDAGVWCAASEWAELAAGPARVAEDVYDWIQPVAAENVLYTATPGPGDSDGGDVYAP